MLRPDSVNHVSAWRFLTVENFASGSWFFRPDLQLGLSYGVFVPPLDRTGRMAHQPLTLKLALKGDGVKKVMV
ncbi:MAG: hypothetical protein WAN18_25265, partial [Candidatus Sulfotelmatobacter sp.]